VLLRLPVTTSSKSALRNIRVLWKVKCITIHRRIYTSASCSKSRYLATEQWTAVRPRTCRPTSHASLMCHLDCDSDHLTLTKWLCHTSTSLSSAGGPSQFSPLICGIASRYTSPHHRRRQRRKTFLFQRSYPDIIWHLIVDLAELCYLEPNSTTRTPATNTGYGQHQRTKNCHLDMSRCWALALRSGKFVVELLWACPLVVSIAGVRSRGVRLVEFGS